MAGETAAIRQGLESLKNQGMRGIPVAGGDLEIRQPDGSIAQAGACETGDRLIGRADHPEYSFAQLALKRRALGELSRSEGSRQEWMEQMEHQLGAQGVRSGQSGRRGGAPRIRAEKNRPWGRWGQVFSGGPDLCRHESGSAV